MGETDISSGEGRRRADGLAGGRFRPPPEPASAAAEDSRGGGCVARAAGYRGASDVTRRLFEYWFEEDHEIAGFDAPFRYYFCQREAIETLAWLVEIDGRRDARALVETYATVTQRDLISKNIEFQTTMDGRRQLRRYVPELGAGRRTGSAAREHAPPRVQDGHGLGEDLGDGDGDRVVRLHKQHVSGSELFHELPCRGAQRDRVSAPGKGTSPTIGFFTDCRWFHRNGEGGFSQKVILRGDAAEPAPTGNLFLANIQQLYESRDEEWTADNAVEALLGRGSPRRTSRLPANAPCWSGSSRSGTSSC